MKQCVAIAAAFLLLTMPLSPRVGFAADAPKKFDVAGDDDAPALKFVVVENGKAPDVFPGFDKQIVAYCKANAVADDHKIRIGVKHYYQDSVGFHDMIAVIVPLNAKDQADGLESEFKEYIGLIHTAEYKDGLKDGIERELAGSYATAYTRIETPWRAGKINGTRKMFHANKKLLNETNYENGIENGESKSYDADGNLIRTVTFKDGRREGNMTDVWPGTDKPKRVVPYKNGKIEGVVHDFYLEGQPKAEIPFTQDRQQGIEKQFQPDGKIIKTVYWVGGEQVTQAEFEKRTH